ncbi:hypothetical protein E1182_29850 [Micromonospora sp. KC721]|nr:hypothetical protein E1182_29850 [Micromonospora sp. KC721]
MIAIAAGRVTVSDQRTRSHWSVDLAPYQLAAVPVTQALYARVTGRRPSAARGDRLPVESVSWRDAVRFCNSLSRQQGLPPVYRLDGDGVECDATGGYRLPTDGGRPVGPLLDIIYIIEPPRARRIAFEYT